MVNLMGKRILLIMPEFYAYQKSICQELERRGAEPYLLYEEPPRLVRLAIKNINTLLKLHTVHDRFNRKLLRKAQAQPKFDWLLVIRGNVLTEDTVKTIISSCLKDPSHSVYYGWDSIKFLYNGGNIIPCFHKKYSFDLYDAEHVEGLEFLPLFYASESDDDPISEERESLYDLSSIAGFNYERYAVLANIKKEHPQWNCFFKLYLSKSLYVIKRVKERKKMACLSHSMICSKPFTAQAIRKVSLQSRAVVDITHPGQQGLSLRILETLSVGKKIITNNDSIRRYPFYNPQTVLILPKEKERLNEDWLCQPAEIEKNMIEDYSIEKWVDKLFAL